MKKRLLFSLVVLIGMLLFSSSIVCADAPAPVAKTGQTTSYLAGDDGDLEKGVAWPIPRFTDHGDGTVTDNLTGLMWTLVDEGTWFTKALAYARNLSLGNAGCGASYTDWRVPNVNELRSLIDLSNFSPALPSDHPFGHVPWENWTSTICSYDASKARTVMVGGRGDISSEYRGVMPMTILSGQFYVRGGN